MYQPIDFCIDIHTHPTIFPLLVRAVESPWHDYDEAPKEKRMHRTVKITREDFSKMHRGKVRVYWHSLHIPERYTLGKAFSSPLIMEKVIGLCKHKMRDVLAYRPFKMMLEEFDLMKRYLNDPHSDRKVQIAQNYSHLLEILKDPKSIAAIMTIEGAHNLGFEYTEDKFIYNGIGLTIEDCEPVHEGLIEERIKFMKDNFIRFFTLNHFVYNHLASMPKAVDLTGIKKIVHNPIQSLRQMGTYRGLTFWGYYMVERCMEEGVMIDVKHCDAISRNQIYKLAFKHRVPVIASHMAVSGKNTNVDFHRMINLREDHTNDRIKALKFNPWDINLHDDDLVSIHQLGGLMGIINDVRVLSSAEEEKLAIKTGDWVRMIYNQIEHIYTTLVKNDIPANEAFNTICIGTDFDGLIDPVNTIPTAVDLLYNPDTDNEETTKLDRELYRLIDKNYKIFQSSGLSPQIIVEKIMKTNVMKFLEKHF